MPVSRRSFLQGTAAGAAATALAGSRAALACTTPTTKVLEIFCVGGFFHWPAARPSAMAVNNLDFLTQNPGVTWASVAGTDPWAPPSQAINVQSGVIWGPAAYPLYLSGLSLATRLVGVGHDVEAHEPAVVHALTGSKLGRASACSLGSALNHHYGAVVSTPDVYSVTLETQAAPTTYASRVAALAGTNGPAYAPVTVPVSTQAALTNFLSTLTRPQRTDTDPLKERYRDRYAAALTHVTDGRVRSASFDAFDGAFEQLLDHTRLRDVLTMATAGNLPAQWNTTTSFTHNATRGAIHYGIDLLRAGSSPLRHVAVMDHGWGGDYDTHNDRGPLQSGGNLWNVFRALAEKHTAQALTDVLVVIHSEFSRVQYDGDLAGTEHWPWATATFLVGGPVTTPGFEGSYTMQANPHLPYEDGLYTPADLRAVVEWAAGIPDPCADYVDLDQTASIRQLGGSTQSATETVACSVLGL